MIGPSVIKALRTASPRRHAPGPARACPQCHVFVAETPDRLCRLIHIINFEGVYCQINALALD